VDFSKKSKRNGKLSCGSDSGGGEKVLSKRGTPKRAKRGRQDGFFGRLGALNI